MTSAKKSFALAAIMAVGALAASAQSASAYVVCNGAECWHTERHYRAPARLKWHNDDYYFHRSWGHDNWRDHHDGRGYYRNGVWITF